VADQLVRVGAVLIMRDSHSAPIKDADDTLSFRAALPSHVRGKAVTVHSMAGKAVTAAGKAVTVH
jgi:hypothetical protein